jgi:hypothetical protein
MTRVYWFAPKEQGGFPVLRAAIGDCDLSVLHVDGEWQWLVRQDGRDIAEGRGALCRRCPAAGRGSSTERP